MSPRRLFTASFVALVLACLAFHANAHGAFPFALGSTGQEYGKALCTDGDDNVIVTLLFQNTVDFDPTSGVSELTSGGGIDTAIVKYDRYGRLVWARRLGGTAATTTVPHGVVADAAGNIYVAGYFGNSSGTVQTTDFDPGAGTHNLTTLGQFDVYLMKLTPEGTLVWVLRLGNSAASTEERAWDILLGPDGGLYIAGAFAGTVDFNPLGTARTLNGLSGPSGSGHSLFLARYDAATGQNTWVLGIDANITNVFNEGYTTIATDSSGHVFLAGNFRSTTSFSGTSLTSRGLVDIFLARYNAETGVQDWVVQLGGTGNDLVSPGAMRGDGENVYVTGRFSGTADFDPGAGTRNLSTPVGVNCLWVGSYTGAGAMRWAFHVPTNTGISGGHRVALDPNRNVFVAGWFAGTGDFDPSGATANLTVHGTSADVFIAKYDTNGNYLWARGYGSADGTDQNLCAGLALDSANNAFITGQIYGTNADFDPTSGSALLSSAGQNDCFVAKYDESGNPAILGAVFSAAPTAQLTATTVTEGTLQFETRSGLNVKVQTSSDLVTWTDEGTTVAGDGALQQRTVTLTSNAFWRVRHSY